VNTRIDWRTTDETRRRIRALYGRGGLATCQEVRAFLLEELEQSVKDLPALTPPQSHDIDPDDWICATCRARKANHRGRRLPCPASSPVPAPAGSVFVPVVDHGPVYLARSEVTQTVKAPQ
jgi:hypothetical protein